MSLVDRLKDRLRPEEGGFYARPYRDSRGILTIAYGFNLERFDADTRLKALGLSPTAVKAGAWPLTPQQGEDLLDYDAMGAITDACDVVGVEVWVTLPEDAQLVLADMTYNMGAGGLGAFKKMLAAVRKVPPDWVEMERQMADSQWDKQVGRRADELEKLIHALTPRITEEDRARVLARVQSSMLAEGRLPAGAHASDQDPEPPAAA